MAIVMDILLGIWVFILGSVIWNKLDSIEKKVDDMLFDGLSQEDIENLQ